VPVAGTAVIIAVSTRQQAKPPEFQGQRWWPDWQDPQTWRLGLLLGLGQMAYWVPNSFIADYLRTGGHSEYIAAALTSLNAGQIPASLLVAAFPRLLVQKRWPLLLNGGLIVCATLGLVVSPPALAALWCALLGFSGAFVFILNLALPPLLAKPHDVHRLSAGIFSISYSCAFFGPLLGGALWDATRIPASGFWPVIAGAAIMSWLALRIDLTRGRSATS
ncbi:MAG TPA: MFS transporter, partial [Chloroflexota bacterium]|nr:MFS transporter [Chloroflexota bacterium]